MTIETGYIGNEDEMKVLNYLLSNSSEAFDKKKWLLLGAGYCFSKSIGYMRSNIDSMSSKTVLVFASQTNISCLRQRALYYSRLCIW